jgi:phosphoribosyl 1,2-cyclic phosphodiesterase
MALFTASLNSGSNGNCYYVGTAAAAVLIDVGISCRETEKRMKQLSLSMDKVKAIFVSHEHGDHIKGVSTLANKYQLPVYITERTAKNGPILIRHLSRPFEADKPVAVGELTVTPFAKKHDAADPHSFIVSADGIHVGVFTDIGRVCNNVLNSFKQCHAVFLEANYDETMLENGRYPLHLKNRIRGGEGHLSNREALELFTTHRSPFLSHLILSHLSKENNSPERVSELFAPHAANTSIVIASRHEASAVFTITAAAGTPQLRKLPPVQLGLFA